MAKYIVYVELPNSFVYKEYDTLIGAELCLLRNLRRVQAGIKYLLGKLPEIVELSTNSKEVKQIVESFKALGMYKVCKALAVDYEFGMLIGVVLEKL